MALIKGFDSDTLQSHHWSRLGTLFLHSLLPSFPHESQARKKRSLIGLQYVPTLGPTRCAVGCWVPFMGSTRWLWLRVGTTSDPGGPHSLNVLFLKDSTMNNQNPQGDPQRVLNWCVSLVKSLLQTLKCLDLHHCRDFWIKHSVETVQNIKQVWKVNSFHHFF